MSTGPGGKQPAGAGKKGAPLNQACKQKLARLKTIVEEPSQWAEQIASVKGMQQWVLDAEHILDGSWAKPGERLSNREQLDDASMAGASSWPVVWQKAVGRRSNGPAYSSFCTCSPTCDPI